MEYNIDFGNITLKPPPAPKPANQGPLYAAVDGKAASLSNNECVFQPTGGGELEVMTHQVLQALDQCREFHTLDEHVARVVGVVPGLAGQSEAVRRVLNGLISRGLLRPTRSSGCADPDRRQPGAGAVARPGGPRLRSAGPGRAPARQPARTGGR